MGEAYNNFMESTGFGQTPAGNLNQIPNPVKAPHHAMQQGNPRPFIGNYDQNDPPAFPRKVPNTVPGQRVPGSMGTNQALQHHQYDQPYRNYPAMGPGTQLQHWQAVGIGPDQSNPNLMQPASKKEKATAAAADQEKIYLIGMVVFGLGFFGGAYKYYQDKDDKKWGMATLVLLGLAVGSAGMYGNTIKKKKEEMRAPLMEGSTRLDVAPLQTDEIPYNPFPTIPDPKDNIEQRLRYQGIDQNRIEGPRRDMGYRRSHLPYATLDPKQLMRDPRNYNMDDGTFTEYMRRLSGEAPNNFVQSHPYMTFNPNWENRQLINDAEELIGLSTSPGQMNRKWPYKNPKIDQAGAKQMHLKDPPPGSMQPLSKTHPWMEDDPVDNDPRYLGLNTSQLQEKVHAVDIQNMMQERSKDNSNFEHEQKQTSIDEDFLQPINVARPPPQNIENILMEERLGGQRMHPQMESQTGASSSNGMRKEAQPQPQEEAMSEFEKSFMPKAQPSTDDLHKEMNNVRR